MASRGKRTFAGMSDLAACVAKLLQHVQLEDATETGGEVYAAVLQRTSLTLCGKGEGS